jgi:SAM-dependent methyltransferase
VKVSPGAPSVRDESIRVYRTEGVDGVKRWMVAVGVTLDDLRRAHAGDPAALDVIDTLLSPESALDFETAVDRHLAPLAGTALHAVHRANLLDTGYARSQLAWYARFARVEGSRVLDVGSGVGAMLVALAEAGAARVVGLEVDPARHHLARVRTRAMPAVECVLAPDGALDCPDGAFDIAIACHVIEHVDEPAAFVRQLARVLRPGGRAFVSCPNRLWPVEAHSRLPAVTWLPRSAAAVVAARGARATRLPGALRSRLSTLAQVRHFFSCRTLARLVADAGFGIVAASPEARFAAEHPRLSRLVPRSPAAARLLSWDILVVAERVGPRL